LVNRRPLSGRSRGLVVIAGAAIAGAAAGSYWLFLLTIAITYAVLALSLVVLAGWSGQLNLHVAALGLGWGSYAAFALVAYGVPPFWAIAGAGFVTVPFAGLVALAAVRFRGLELAVATIAMGLVFENLFFRNIAKTLARHARGVTTPFESSFVPMPRPSIGGISFTSDAAFYFFCLAAAVVLFVVVGNLGRASTGRTLRALQEREVAAESLGIPVIRYRIGAFVLSIMIASTAGALFAAAKESITPDSFRLDLSFQILAAVVIGGLRSPMGAVIGGGLAALLPEIVRWGPLQIFEGERLFVLFGVGMILVLWRLPTGLAGAFGERRERAKRRASTPTTEVSLGMLAAFGGELADADATRRVYETNLDRHAARPVLRAENIRVRFGGVLALDGCSISVPENEICALIGPNGAGKSTLFNCIDGLVAPDDGQIYLGGLDVTDLPTHRRAALGVSRTFQTVEVFRSMSVLENLMVAGHRTRRAGPLHEVLALPTSTRSERELASRARGILATLGMEAIAERRPGDLPLGLLRVLEVGMALVARPRLLLVDEPSAGLDAQETESLALLLARVRSAYRLAVLLVEHDMSFVGRLAEHVYVLDFGRIIAQGTVERIRRDPLVIARYLGEEPAGESTERPPRRSTLSGARSGGGR
jgi:branched-chain amino acid transport system permease protein